MAARVLDALLANERDGDERTEDAETGVELLAAFFEDVHRIRMIADAWVEAHKK